MFKNEAIRPDARFLLALSLVLISLSAASLIDVGRLGSQDHGPVLTSALGLLTCAAALFSLYKLMTQRRLTNNGYVQLVSMVMAGNISTRMANDFALGQPVSVVDWGSLILLLSLSLGLAVAPWLRPLKQG